MKNLAKLIEELEGRQLGCLIPAPNSDVGIVCHEHSCCDCEVKHLLTALKEAKELARSACVAHGHEPAHEWIDKWFSEEESE